MEIVKDRSITNIVNTAVESLISYTVNIINEFYYMNLFNYSNKL